jgi:hypothetical protein
VDGWSIARGFVANPVIAISVSVIPMSLKASHVWPPSVATIGHVQAAMSIFLELSVPDRSNGLHVVTISVHVVLGLIALYTARWVCVLLV